MCSMYIYSTAMKISRSAKKTRIGTKTPPTVVMIGFTAFEGGLREPPGSTASVNAFVARAK